MIIIDEVMESGRQMPQTSHLSTINSSVTPQTMQLYDRNPGEPRHPTPCPAKRRQFAVTLRLNVFYLIVTSLPSLFNAVRLYQWSYSNDTLYYGVRCFTVAAAPVEVIVAVVVSVRNSREGNCIVRWALRGEWKQ